MPRRPAILAAVALTLAGLLPAAAWAGSGCDTSCPPGATHENDACGPGPDPNGGCTVNPPAFQFVPFDSPICGSVGGWVDPVGTPGRDSDWFVFAVAEPSIITVTVHQESAATGSPSGKFVVALLDSTTCGSQQYLAFVIGGTCPIVTQPVIVQPGEYVLALTVDGFGTSDPSSACPVDYVARIGVDQLYPSCTGSSATCLNSHSTPGCGDTACCSSVCADPLYAYCCTIAWDAYCAAQASMKEECAGDGCPRARVKSSVAKFLVDRSRGKMTLPDPDLPEVHLQMSTAISLTTAAQAQLPHGDGGTSCQGINVAAVDAKFDKVIALDAFSADQVEYLIQHPELTADEVAAISAIVEQSLEGAVAIYDEILQLLSPCPGDLVADGTVDGADLAVLLGNWGLAGIGDLDQSGAVDGADLAILLGA